MLKLMLMTAAAAAVTPLVAAVTQLVAAVTKVCSDTVCGFKLNGAGDCFFA